MIEIGEAIGHYEIREKLGAGGMGEVYRAKDLHLGREVAIKVLLRNVAADPNRLIRFEQEARAASALNHPNIVTIHEIGHHDGGPYIVMELVEGRTLRTLLAWGRPALTKRTLEYAAQIAEGLAKAHAAGIVHRDLKPENVMVTGDGRVKLLDFGLAKLVTSGSGDKTPEADSTAPTAEALAFKSPDTHSGAVLGTAGYMSPEQARGEPVDFRGDQFALGAILYEIATGQRAFRRESTVQTLAAIIEMEPQPLVVLNPSAPPAFCQIVERCLAKDPQDRYASTGDLARELKQAAEQLEDAPTLSSPPPTYRPRQPMRHGRLRRAAAVGAALALGGLVLWSGPVHDALFGGPLPRVKQLAVLPFSHAGADATSQAFCDGLAETLTSKLTELERFQGSLSVLPASELRGSAVTTVAAARRSFGVTLAVTGSVQRTGDRIRLTVNLVDARTLRQLRARSLDTRLEDLATLQDTVVQAVADMLELEVGAEAGRVLAAGRTSVAGAYDLYLQGKGHLQRYENEDRVKQAISAFQGALQKDTGYALAYAGLCEAHLRLYRLTKDPQSVDVARHSCDRALEINDLLAPVHVSLGNLREETGEAEAALRDYERALALDPSSLEALKGSGSALERLGRAREAETAYKKALEQRPGDSSTHLYLGTFYFRQARYAEAEREFRRVIELSPDNTRGYANLGGLLHQLGRDDEAAPLLQRALAIRPTPDAASNLATIEFSRGRYAEAARAYERAIELSDRDYRLWRNLAAARFLAPGERDRAAAAYDKAAVLAEAGLAVNPRDAAVLIDLADCRAMLGDRARARDLVARALVAAPGDVEVMQQAASVYEQLGDRAAALQWIRRALAGGYPIEQVDGDPFLKGLRADPRFPASAASPIPGPKASAAAPRG